AWKLLGLSGEGSGSRREVVELGWNGGSWWEMFGGFTWLVLGLFKDYHGQSLVN
nr:hypothetical protein [Tanacetum cinerariifolium]